MVYIIFFLKIIFSIYKRLKLDNQLLFQFWHCRLGHINKIRIIKLHKNGYYDPFDYESYETCETYLMGKMTKTSFKRKDKWSQ